MNEELMMNDVAEVEANECEAINVDACVDGSNDHKFLKGAIVGGLIVGTGVVIVKGGKWALNKCKSAWENHKSKKAEESEEILDAEVSED